MDPEKWFGEFMQEYKAIVQKEYPGSKELFPLYSPVEVNVYLVDDVRRIFPEVVVFFLRIDEFSANYLSEDVFVFKEKIKWPANFDSLEPDEQEMIALGIDYDVFKERRFPMGYLEESHKMRLFDSDPKDRARIKVNEDLIRGFRKELIDVHSKITSLRRKTLSADKISQFLSKLERLERETNDKLKADLISEAFWLLGFEAMNLERMKDLPEYKRLNNLPHVDVLAFLMPDRFLVAIEEGKITKERWFKESTLRSTLETLGMRREEWRIFFLWIGRESSGVVHLEGIARRLSYENFFRIIETFMKGEGWAPNLRALWALFDHKTKLFSVP